MKSATTTAAVALITGAIALTARAQATFVFNNYVPGVNLDAPVFDADGNRLAGTNYVAVLYGGAATDSLELARVGNSDMSPIPFTYMPNGQSGYFGVGGGVTVYGGVPEGGYAWLQVRAWDMRLGTSYDDVAGLGLGGYGESSLFYTYGGDDHATGRPHQPLRGLESFNLRPVPEPTTWALLALGAGFLCWRWRRKR